jgi:hypothetical protein
MAQNNFTIEIKILDEWDIMNNKWEYICYVLCDVSGRLYLFEKNLNTEND